MKGVRFALRITLLSRVTFVTVLAGNMELSLFGKRKKRLGYIPPKRDILVIEPHGDA